MEPLEGEDIKGTIINYLKRFREWLKPNPADTLLLTSFKMIYKALAVLVLVALSPVIFLILLLVFFAAL